MTVTKPSSSGAGSEFAKGIGGLLLIAAAVYFVQWGIGKVLWVWGKIKLGFFTAGKTAVCVGGLVILSFIIALICDLLAPLIRRIRKDREKRRAISRCRLPDINTFRTGISSKEGEVGKIDSFMASLLRERYRQITGSFPNRFAFKNNASAYSAFKAGELPNALRGAENQVEQDLFVPLIAAYLTNSCHQIVKEER